MDLHIQNSLATDVDCSESCTRVAKLTDEGQFEHYTAKVEEYKRMKYLFTGLVHLLEGAVVSANFLNPDVAFPRNEWLSCSVSIGQSNNTRDILETTVVVNTNLQQVKNKDKKNKRDSPHT